MNEKNDARKNMAEKAINSVKSKSELMSRWLRVALNSSNRGMLRRSGGLMCEMGGASAFHPQHF